MRMYDIIKKKRDGGILSKEEIDFFCNGYVEGKIPDYQIAALCMAIYFQGMTAEETTYLTLAVRDSGDTLEGEGFQGLRVDKHSTGGVGDKTSLVVAPIVASLGITVAKMSGRGLGHTGGTVDKLEAIPGFRTDLSTEEFLKAVEKSGIAIVGQSKALAPCDKLLYALRDVTATVDSMPLIASSIMGKKLAANDDCIVLDVKTGSGSFMKSEDDSVALAELMVDIGKRAGKKMLALVTDMDRPLGCAIGNALEVKEALETLSGKGPSDLRELCCELAAGMLYLAEKGSYEDCKSAAASVLESGKALQKFYEMVAAQGGDVTYVENPELFEKAPYEKSVIAPCDGYIFTVNAEEYGRAALVLGAGRNTMEDKIDPSAGIVLTRKTGDLVKRGDVIATLYSSKEESLFAGEKIFLDATCFSDIAPQARPLIFRRIE